MTQPDSTPASNPQSTRTERPSGVARDKYGMTAYERAAQRESLRQAAQRTREILRGER